MIKHIVFFRLLKVSSKTDKQHQLKRLEELFFPLGDIFPFIVEFRTGINFTDAPHAWDFAIDSVFRNKEDLEIYMESFEHKEAVRIASEIEKTKAVVDYEF